MEKIVITGGKPLLGKVKVSGAKNAALPIMAASLLTSETLELSNIPKLADITTMDKLLQFLGAEIISEKNKTQIRVKKLIKDPEAPYDLVRTMRASVLVLGPLVARCGYAKVSLPGGCAIGARPINYHLSALEQMGAKITLEGGYVTASTKKLIGATIHFDEVTVTGTENILMAATLAKGKTIITNAAIEPEVTDLAHLLVKMGANIEGIGTTTLTINGVENLHSASHQVIGDRIEAGTFMMACALAGGEIEVLGISSKLMQTLIEKLKLAGAKIDEGDSIKIKAPKIIKSVDISTGPYPSFPTDFQAQFMALMTLAEGASIIKENIFENRFMHVAELNRMGADISVDGNTAIVKGVKNLTGAPVMATDLRASASLILAGLKANGTTEVLRIYHLDRGYENIEKKLKNLGAQIKRVKVKS